ncbi:MAG: hypothetical protein ABL884_07135 [Methyloglobulus sp.]
MAFNKIAGLVISILALNMGILEDASAASISVKCETRGTSRSKASVDGAGLTGTFYAILYSPGSGAVKSKAPKTANVSHQVEFDFDSYPPDIAAGATKISPTFIKNKTVYGYIRRVSNNYLEGVMKATCQAK